LPEECNRLLVELLRVSDICRDDAVEGEAVCRGGLNRGKKLLAVLLGSNCNLSTYGILSLQEVRVDVFGVEGAAWSCSAHAGGFLMMVVVVVEVQVVRGGCC